MKYGHDPVLYADTLLGAARADDRSQAAAALLMTHLLDGEAGLRAALAQLADTVTANVPRPASGAHYHCHAVAFYRDETGHYSGAEDVPSEVRWALDMITARLNGRQAEFDQLIQVAVDTRRLAVCSFALAAMAARADEINTVVL